MRKAWFVALLGLTVGLTYTATAATNRLLMLDGVDDYVSVPYAEPLNLSTGDFSVLLWVNLDTFQTQLHSVLLAKRGTGSPSLNDGWFYSITGNGLGADARKVNWNLSTGNIIARSMGVLGTNRWYHLSVVYNSTASNITFYIDGEFDIQVNNIPSPNIDPTELRIGHDSNLSNPDNYALDGAMDDIQIWSKALNQCEIHSLMETRPTGIESNLVAFWTFDNGTASDATANANNGTFEGGAATVADLDAVTNNIYFAVEIPFFSGSPLMQYQLQFTTNLLTGPWIDSGAPVVGNGGQVSLFDGPRGASPRFYRVNSVYSSLTEGLVAYFPFNGNANDVSGNGWNGTVNGPTLIQNRFGNANSAYWFNGTNDYIDVGDINSLDNIAQFSISVWFMADSFGSALRILGKEQDNNDQNGVSISTQPDYLRLVLRNGADGYVDATNTLQTGRWYNVVTTFDGTKAQPSDRARIYLDGTLLALQLNGSIPNATPDTSFPLWIGGISPNPTQSPWNGKIDDIRIYNRALSSGEVSNLYHLPY